MKKITIRDKEYDVEDTEALKLMVIQDLTKEITKLGLNNGRR